MTGCIDRIAIEDSPAGSRNVPRGSRVTAAVAQQRVHASLSDEKPMVAPETSCYVTGGTLRSDAPSYVERQADKDLYEGAPDARPLPETLYAGLAVTANDANRISEAKFPELKIEPLGNGR